MLILTRRCRESILIGEDIMVTFLRWENGRAVLGVTAPIQVKVDREEVRRGKEKKAAGPGETRVSETTKPRREAGA